MHDGGQKEGPNTGTLEQQYPYGRTCPRKAGWGEPWPSLLLQSAAVCGSRFGAGCWSLPRPAFPQQACEWCLTPAVSAGRQGASALRCALPARRGWVRLRRQQSIPHAERLRAGCAGFGEAPSPESADGSGRVQCI